MLLSKYVCQNIGGRKKNFWKKKSYLRCFDINFCLMLLSKYVCQNIGGRKKNFWKKKSTLRCFYFFRKIEKHFCKIQKSKMCKWSMRISYDMRCERKIWSNYLELDKNAPGSRHILIHIARFSMRRFDMRIWRPKKSTTYTPGTTTICKLGSTYLHIYAPKN